MSDKLFTRLLNDIRVDLADEFDRNFERKAFFDEPWPGEKIPNRKGSLMARKNHLRRSINSRVSGMNIIFESHAVYANIHNNGGKIRVSGKMKKFFWAMYYKNGGGQKKGKTNRTAEMWKAMALKPVGSIIEIPQRQFIGTHAKVHQSIERAGSYFLRDIEDYLNQIFKKHK